jgi:hypothetical protein
MPVDEWLESHADRVAALHASTADTAKLVATFTTGVAAALVAAALQTGATSTRDRTAAWLLAASAALVLMVVIVDRRVVADHREIIQRSRLLGWNDAQTLAVLRVEHLAAVYANESVVRRVLWTLAVQVSVSGTAAAVAALSLVS